ncbi:MAG TPA: DUF3488 and transglutaminase-like domain-containing protein [Nevskiaceae bacterium]|nr:DUF3488 and transglutaminase-like domain-containing protein [Nevskiaceae bacterium]
MASERAPALHEFLPTATLLRLLGVLLLVLLPHLPRLPLWESGLVAAVLVWRALAARRSWRMPPTWLKALLTIAAFIGVQASYGRVSGQNAGVALLVIMLALKLTEMKARRDVMVMVFMLYFLLFTHFLFSQELWTAAFLIACAVAITGLLIEAHHPGSALPPRISLRLGGAMVAQALPLMVLFFVLFPRVPGPLWGLPSDSGAARSGLSDSLSPGDISSLIQSDEVAFRVRFDGEVPPMRQRYWRGPVFNQFDGRRWEAGYQIASRPQPVTLRGPALDYEVVLEAHRMPWLFALDLPDPRALPADARLNGLQQLLAAKVVRERMSYRLRSHVEYTLQPELSEGWRRTTLQLPPDSNPRTRDMAQRWAAETPDAAALVERLLRHFRTQEFFYTLTPPELGRHTADEFLFDTRRGFCEHYASSFVVFMRAAGIPARVVTGYQGGEPNVYGDYYVVRQSDAHAWAEVWMPARGWVRVDPTAAVAPERIERGMQEQLRGNVGIGELMAGGLSWTRLKYQLEARWEWINAQWNGLVLGYGQELQQDFLRRLGLIDVRSMILALVVGVSLLLGLIGVWELRKALPASAREPALRRWRRLQARLQRLGHVPAPGEGPRDFIQRVIAARPDWRAELEPALQAYLRLRYAGEDDPALLRTLSAVRLPRR